MDNRASINKELGEILNPGVVSVLGRESLGVSELPNTSGTETLGEAPNTTNNFNVNVNVSGSSPSRDPKSQAQTIINNVLKSPQALSASDIKKNWGMDFESGGNTDTSTSNIEGLEVTSDNGQQSADILSSNYVQNNFEMGLGGNTNNPIPSVKGLEVTSDNPTLKLSEGNSSTPTTHTPFLPNVTDTQIPQIQSEIEKLKIINTIESDYPNLPTLGVSMTSSDQSMGSNYSYSTADIKNTNRNINTTLNMVNNIIQSSYGGALPSAEITNSTNNELNDNRRYYNSKNSSIETYNSNNYLEQIDQITRDHERTIINRHNTVEATMIQMGEQQSNRGSNMELLDAMGEMPPSDPTDYSETQTSPMREKEFTHLNDAGSTIDSFIAEMNSPPNWRTVLG